MYNSSVETEREILQFIVNNLKICLKVKRECGNSQSFLRKSKLQKIVYLAENDFHKIVVKFPGWETMS